jgi:hypothetical protein
MGLVDAKGRFVALATPTQAEITAVDRQPTAAGGLMEHKFSAAIGAEGFKLGDAEPTCFFHGTERATQYIFDMHALLATTFATRDGAAQGTKKFRDGSCFFATDIQRMHFHMHASILMAAWGKATNNATIPLLLDNEKFSGLRRAI